MSASYPGFQPGPGNSRPGSFSVSGTDTEEDVLISDFEERGHFVAGSAELDLRRTNEKLRFLGDRAKTSCQKVDQMVNILVRL